MSVLLYDPDLQYCTKDLTDDDMKKISEALKKEIDSVYFSDQEMEIYEEFKSGDYSRFYELIDYMDYIDEFPFECMSSYEYEINCLRFKFKAGKNPHINLYTGQDVSKALEDASKNITKETHPEFFNFFEKYNLTHISDSMHWRCMSYN